jgi:hypothetical protein
MAMQFSVAARNGMGDALIAAVGNAGVLRIISGTKPADAAAAQTGTTLSAHTLASPFAPAAASGTVSPTLPTNVAAAAGGTATHYRVLTSALAVVWQNDVVSSGSGLVLNPSSNVITAGQPVQVNSWTIPMGGA